VKDYVGLQLLGVSKESISAFTKKSTVPVTGPENIKLYVQSSIHISSIISEILLDTEERSMYTKYLSNSRYSVQIQLQINL
jgi:hypothetical protein